MNWGLAIFDWNGTLFNDLLNPVYGSVQEIFRVYGLPAPSLETYRNEITSNFIDFYRKYGIKDATPEELNVIRKRYFKAHGNEGTLHPGVHRMLDMCVNLEIPCAIVSGEIKRVLTKRLMDLKLASYFYKVMGNARNKTEALRETCAFFEVAPKTAVYIDDSYDGIMAAKRARLYTVGFGRGYATEARIREAKPDFPNENFPTVRTMSDIEGILLRGRPRR